MLCNILLALIFSSNLSLSTSSSDGTKFYLNKSSISQMGLNDTWLFEYRQGNALQKVGLFCWFRPHEGKYSITSSSREISKTEESSDEWDDFGSGQVITYLIEDAIAFIVGHQKQFNIDGIISSPGQGLIDQHEEEWHEVTDQYYAKDVSWISKDLVEIWTSQSSLSGIRAQIMFENYRVVQKLVKYEMIPSKNKIRACDIVTYNDDGEVIESYSQCGSWSSIVPGSNGASFLKYVKNNFPYSNKK